MLQGMANWEELVELYTDYLIVVNGQATATGLSAVLDNEISHDKFTRMLSSGEFNSRYLWKKVKKSVPQVESEQGCLIIDDTIVEKPWTDENEIVCWHYDHSKGRNVKGFNIINLLYHSNDISIPVGFEVVKKPIVFVDKKGKRKRGSEVTKNELMRYLIQRAIQNQIFFSYVLMDSWFASKENFEFITKHKKHFIAAVKGNRLFAGSLEDKLKGRFERVDELGLRDKESVRGYLRGYDKEVVLTCRVFTNKDGSTGRVYLVCSDVSLSSDHIAAIYQKRWKVEEYHRSLKSNAAVAKSPTKRVSTQISHLVMSMIAVFKLECLKIKHHLNHFALRAKVLIKANFTAMTELRKLCCA